MVRTVQRQGGGMARMVPGRWTKAHVAGVGGAASARSEAGGIGCEPFCHGPPSAWLLASTAGESNRHR